RQIHCFFLYFNLIHYCYYSYRLINRFIVIERGYGWGQSHYARTPPRLGYVFNSGSGKRNYPSAYVIRALLRTSTSVIYPTATLNRGPTQTSFFCYDNSALVVEKILSLQISKWLPKPQSYHPLPLLTFLQTLASG